MRQNGAMSVVRGLSAPRRWASIVIVWVAAAVAAVLVPLLVVSGHRDTWFSLSFAACVIIGMIVQLSTQQKVGLVTRFVLSIVGAAIVLAVGIGITALVG